MKRLLSILLAVAIMASFVGCGGGNSKSDESADSAQAPAETTTDEAAADEASADEVYEWKFGTIYANPTVNTEFNSQAMGQQHFCDLINERSGGRLVVTPYYDGVLGTSNELYEQCQNGELEIYLGQPMSNYDKRYAAWSIPFLFENYEEVKGAICDQDSDLYKMSAEWVSENGLKLLAIGSGSIRGFINSKKEIKTLDDIKGLKVRTYQDPIVSAFWADICNATPLSMGEVYTSLQTGAIDGMEFCCTNVIGQKLYEVTKYFSDINWQWCAGAQFIVSEKAYNELPEDLQQLVSECAKEAMEWQVELEMSDYEKAIDKLKELGIECYELTPEERQTFIDYAATTEAATKEFIGEDVYDAVIAARDAYRAAH